MRAIIFSIWLPWLLETNAELTLESVHQMVNDLRVEMTSLKVFDYKLNGYLITLRHRLHQTVQAVLTGDEKSSTRKNLNKLSRMKTLS